MDFLKKAFNVNIYFGIAIFSAILGGYFELDFLISPATTVSEIFINLLQLVSLPIIFLSIVSTASGMENMEEIKNLGKRVVKYTLLTTVIAASVALFVFVVIDPLQSQTHLTAAEVVNTNTTPYVQYLVDIVPSNIMQPFVNNHVIGVFFIAVLLSLAIISLPTENRKVLHQFFSSLYAAIMKITSWIVRLMPLAIWAFITLFIRDLRQGLEIQTLAFYLICVVVSNLLQAFVVLPTILKIKGISPFQTAKGMFPALSLAFFTKSSSATLPMAMKCAEENLRISRKVASFSLPLCTTINMNACAAFILTTVLFVSMSNGVTYTAVELGMWVIVATIAAVGNASVPMGCYFLSSALLASMNVPLNILGVILPFYSLIDMLETSINVWSDSCVTAVVDQEVSEKAPVEVTANPSTLSTA